MTAAPTTPPGADDAPLLGAVEAAVRAAGTRLLATWSPGNRPVDRAGLLAGLARNEELAAPGLRADLTAARPGAGWLAEEQETTALPAGEWWVVDAVEGNVNHLHGLPEWAVSATLVRDGVPVLAAVHQPVGDRTFTALHGGGARLDGELLHVSATTDLGVAVASTGQAEAGQTGTYRRIGDSVTAMLGSALLVRATVPSTFPLLLVAAGHTDLFWQYGAVLPGVAAGVLLVQEAGGVVSQVDGRPWAPGSPDVLVAAPGVHAAAVATLAAV